MVGRRTRKNKPSMSISDSKHYDMHNNMYPHEVTFHGLNHWYKHLFEKLGWMILAKHNGMTDKTSNYINSLKRFKHSLEYKLKHTKSPDQKEDIRVMHHNICILYEHAEKDL